MKKNNHDRVVAFYNELHQLVVRNKDFDATTAEILIATRGDSSDCLSIENFTMDTLMECHKKCGDQDNDMDLIFEMAEAAFRDLAPYLRSPRAQAIWELFRDSSGTSSYEDLYVQVRNFRLLGVENDEPAVVTLVVHSLSGLLDLLENGKNGSVFHNHFSEAKQINPA